MDCLPTDIIQRVLIQYSLLKRARTDRLIAILTCYYSQTKAIVPGWIELYNRLRDNWKTAIKMDSPGLLSLTTNLPDRDKLFDRAVNKDSIRVFQWLHDKYGTCPCVSIVASNRIKALVKTLTLTQESCDYWLNNSYPIHLRKIIEYMFSHNMKVHLSDDTLSHLVYYNEWDLIDRVCATGSIESTAVKHVTNTIIHTKTARCWLYQVRFMEWIIKRDYSSTKLYGITSEPSYYLNNIMPILRSREDVPKKFLEELEQMCEKK